MDPIENKSEDEVIKILRENGIKVVYKPFAMMDTNLFVDEHGNRLIQSEPIDIYEALRRIQVRRRLAKDPFS